MEKKIIIIKVILSLNIIATMVLAINFIRYQKEPSRSDPREWNRILDSIHKFLLPGDTLLWDSLVRTHQDGEIRWVPIKLYLDKQTHRTHLWTGDSAQKAWQILKAAHLMDSTRH